MLGSSAKRRTDNYSLLYPLPMGRLADMLSVSKDNQAPVAAVITVIFRDETMILVRRSNPPDAGFWGFPGGKIEFGESIEEAVIRELREETSVVAVATEVFTALDVLKPQQMAMPFSTLCL